MIKIVSISAMCFIRFLKLYYILLAFQFVFAALLAVVYSSGVVPYASPLGAPLLAKINVAPPKVTVVKQPYEITQTEAVYRSVPVPVRAVAYTAPRVVTPVAYAAPVVVSAPLAAPVW